MQKYTSWKWTLNVLTALKGSHFRFLFVQSVVRMVSTTVLGAGASGSCVQPRFCFQEDNPICSRKCCSDENQLRMDFLVRLHLRTLHGSCQEIATYVIYNLI